MNRHTSKLATLLITLAVVVSGIGFSLGAPQTAYALDSVNVNSIGAVPGSVIAAALVHTSTQTGVTSALTGIQTTILQSLNGIAWTVAKVAIQSITKSMVTWINSGFHGSPAFATNLNQSLQHVSDYAAQQLLTDLASNPALKSPFQNSVASTLSKNYYASTGTGGFASQNPYTLNKVSGNDQAFLKGSFSQGGWNAWSAAFSNPANNPYGAYQLAYSALGAQTSNAIGNQQNELNWGRGFASFRGDCPTAQTGGTVDSGGFTCPAGTAYVNGTCSSAGSADTTSATCPAGSTIVAGVCTNGSGPISTPVASLSGTANTCPGQSIQTPGAVVEAQLEQQLGTGVRQLELANSINEIVGALVSQMVNHVLGAGGLAGLSKPSSGGGSSYASQAANPAQYAGNTTTSAQGVAQDVTNQATSLSQYQSNLQTILNAAQAAKTACANDPTALAQIQPVIDQTTAALATASNTLSNATKLQTELNAAQTAPAATQPDAAATASTDYLSFLNAMPSPATLGTTDAQSKDTGNATSPSLYTQMNQLATQCATGLPLKTI